MSLSSTPPQIPYSKFSYAGPFLFLVCTFFLAKLIQTLGLNTCSHLMISQTSSLALTPFLNSRAPIQHNQNQSSSFSWTYSSCLRLIEPKSCGSRNLSSSPHLTAHSLPFSTLFAQFYLHNGSLTSRLSLVHPCYLVSQEFPCLQSVSSSSRIMSTVIFSSFSDSTPNAFP